MNFRAIDARPPPGRWLAGPRRRGLVGPVCRRARRPDREGPRSGSSGAVAQTSPSSPGITGTILLGAGPAGGWPRAGPGRPRDRPAASAGRGGLPLPGEADPAAASRRRSHHRRTRDQRANRALERRPMPRCVWSMAVRCGAPAVLTASRSGAARLMPRSGRGSSVWFFDVGVRVEPRADVVDDAGVDGLANLVLVGTQAGLSVLGA